MSKFDKLLQKLLSGVSDKNIDFVDLVKLLISLDLVVRIKGSHHIFTNPKVEEIEGSKAKAYQVKQVREIIIKYKLINNDSQV